MNTRRGVALSVMASCLFAGMYFYATLLHPLNGEQVFGWRVMFTVPLMTLFMWRVGEWARVTETVARLRAEPVLWVVLPLSSALLGVQLWLFLWAPMHQMALDVSMGYFILPLVMVLVGRVVYREHLSAWQALATACAAAGVVHELWREGRFSWASVLVALGFPAYFSLRKHFRLDHMGGLWIDMALTLPVGLWFVVSQGEVATTLADYPALAWLVPGLGAISASALALYVMAGRHLPFGLFGLLGYVEPVLLLGVAWMLGERIAPQQWLTYGPVWLAVGLLVIEGLLSLRQPKPAA